MGDLVVRGTNVRRRHNLIQIRVEGVQHGYFSLAKTHYMLKVQLCCGQQNTKLLISLKIE